VNNPNYHCDLAIIGAGPAGLKAAEIAATSGLKVIIFERMPTPARKFLMAGKSGLNITHSEPIDLFKSRFKYSRQSFVSTIDFESPDAIRKWALELGVDTFVGSSGRVFPVAMKASPLLRAWMEKLAKLGVELNTRHTWTGWNNEVTPALSFDTPAGTVLVRSKATILALGGASWPRLGSNAAWCDNLAAKGVLLNQFEPSNVGFNIPWSDIFRERFAGVPVKNTGLSFGTLSQKGDFVITQTGVEGSLIYPFSSDIRNAQKSNNAKVTLDLAPDTERTALEAKLSKPRGKRSLTDHMRRTTGLPSVKLGLIREFTPASALNDPIQLANHIKSLNITFGSPRPIEEAISSAGGVSFDAMNDNLMLHALPGVFCSGEMTNWDAPTGGYLITACLAQGHQAALGAIQWLNAQKK
jgi:uncharacterized flavoprotein (TIGR03862 family)